MKAKISLLLILSLLAMTMRAADFVDAINSSTTKREAGHRVIYEMNIGAFTSQGTFNAARQQLAALRQTGIDIVWLMPVYPRGGGINSPYAAKNFRQVNPAYGTVSDLRSFVSRAHELGMEVWLDWVPNHTATDADWVTTHPEYYAKNAQGQMIHPNGYGDVWQLDYNNAALVEEMNNCLKFWVDEADIDGYRCDYVSSQQIPASYWQSAIPAVKSYKSGKSITFMGEADIANDATRLKTVGFDYDYAWAYQTSLLNFGASGTYAASLKANADKLINAQGGLSFGRMVYLTNHDQNWNEQKQTLTQKYGDNRYPLTVLAHTVWGMPLIYNGQEVGGNQPLNYFTDAKIDWSASDQKMLNTLRTLNALKHDVPAFTDAGSTATHHSVSWLNSSSNNVLAYTCKYGDSEALVVLNLATTAVTVTVSGIAPGDYSQWLNSETIRQGVSRRQTTLSSAQEFTLDAKGYRVFVKGSYTEEQLPAQEVYTPALESADEISIFFETPTESTYAAWVWGDLGGGEAYCTNTSWPGDEMTFMGKSESGNNIYKYKITKVSDAPSFLIISKNNGNTKIYDGVSYVNHGYYIEGQTTPARVVTNTGLRAVTVPIRTDATTIYDLRGRRVTSPARPGIYVIGGRKVFLK